jgi:hypothetical protein
VRSELHQLSAGRGAEEQNHFAFSPICCAGLAVAGVGDRARAPRLSSAKARGPVGSNFELGGKRAQKGHPLPGLIHPVKGLEVAIAALESRKGSTRGFARWSAFALSVSVLTCLS